MNTLKATVTRCTLAGLLGLATTSCSLIFVKPPTGYQPGRSASENRKCTSSLAAPVLDTIFTGLEVGRVAYAASAPNSVYADPKQPLSRGVDIGLGLGFSALFLSSAIYGYSATARCNKLKQGLGDEPSQDVEAEAPSTRERAKPPLLAQPPLAPSEDAEPPVVEPAPGTSDDSESRVPPTAPNTSDGL